MKLSGALEQMDDYINGYRKNKGCTPSVITVSGEVLDEIRKAIDKEKNSPGIKEYSGGFHYRDVPIKRHYV